MTQRGIVQRITGGVAVVAVGGGQGCAACNARESCMTITGKRPEEKLVSVENTLGAEVGDAVDLELPVSVTMRIIAVTFMLPVALLLAGYWIMMPAGSSQGALGAVAGLLSGMAAALLLNRRLSGNSRYRMRMSAIAFKKCSETDVAK